MMNFWDSYAAIENDFAAQQIPTADPGFYDHPSFVAAERQNAAYLFNYTRFVADKSYSPTYLARVRKELPFITQAFFQELKAMCRKGACVDASLILSRILEREGIWSCCLTGTLHVIPPAASGLAKESFWSFHSKAVGHAWLFAPPFLVVDVTVKLQPYHDSRLLPHLPDVLLAEAGPRIVPSDRMIVSPQRWTQLQAHGVPPFDILNQCDRLASRFGSTFRSYGVQESGTEFQYLVAGAGFSEGMLEQITITNMNFRGKTGFQVYTDVIQPALRKFRQGL